LYTHVRDTKTGLDARLLGARIHVRAPAGLTEGWLARVLECHGARRVLERPEALTPTLDPYWLPGAWLAVNVSAEDAGFRVDLASADHDAAQAREILARAQRWIASREAPPSEGRPDADAG
jgi:hypothetical protein